MKSVVLRFVKVTQHGEVLLLTVTAGWHTHAVFAADYKVGGENIVNRCFIHYSSFCSPNPKPFFSQAQPNIHY